MADYHLSTDKTYSDTRLDLIECFRKWNNDLSLWGAKAMNVDIEVNTRQYDKEFPSYNQENVVLRRVTVRWIHPKDGERVVSCDRFTRVRDNIRAIYLTLESMRMGEKRVGSDVYRGIARQVVGLIEGPKGSRDPYEVLGLRADASDALVDLAYRELSKTCHPDKPTGSQEAFVELTEARDEIKRRRNTAVASA